MALDTARDAIPGFELAGAIVRRPFNRGGERVAVGTVLSADEFMSIGFAVRRIFVADSHITPFYRRPGESDYVPPPAPVAKTAAGPKPKHHLIHRGGGRYDVLRGVVLNDEPLTRDAAEAIAKQGDQ
jgi:hypothetical protein